MSIGKFVLRLFFALTAVSCGLCYRSIRDAGESTQISQTAFVGCPKIVIESDNNVILPLLGWLALIFIMAATGFFVFRALTAMAQNFARENKQLKKSVRN